MVYYLIQNIYAFFEGLDPNIIVGYKYTKNVGFRFVPRISCDVLSNLNIKHKRFMKCQLG